MNTFTKKYEVLINYEEELGSSLKIAMMMLSTSLVKDKIFNGVKCGVRRLDLKTPPRLNICPKPVVAIMK